MQPPAPGGSALESRHQSEAGQPIANAASIPLPSSPGIVIETIPRLDAFLNQIGTRGHLTDLVSCRASILRDACDYQDTFYLCLHQIFCRATTDPLFTMQIGFGDEQLRGFHVMQVVLLSNSLIPSDALHFFASFPYPDPARTSPLPGHVVAQVRAFLSCLDKHWELLSQTCLARGYPPFTEELRARLRLGSPVFQKVLFNSIHRQLAGLGSPVLIEQGHRLFDENQRESQERLAANGYPPSDQQVQGEVRQLGARYLNLRATTQSVGFETTTKTGIPSADMNRRGTHHSNFTVPGSAGYSDSPAIISSQNTVHSWGANGLLNPSYVQQPFNYSHQPINRSQQSPLQHQYAMTTMQHLPPQAVANAGNHVQQGQPRRRGRPPLSHTRQSSRPTASPTSPTASTSTFSPSRNLASDRGGHVTTTTPAAVPHTSRTSGTPDTAYAPFFPQFGQEPIQGIIQNYRLVALHQAHLRSPKYEIADVKPVTRPVKRLYQVPTGCVLSPKVFSQSCPFFCWQFEISADYLQRKAVDTLFILDPKNPALAEPVRQVTGGSLLYRLKCIQIPATAPSTSITEDVWVTRETVWPNAIFPAINDQQLEVRRRLHHGKDLTIDITKYLKEGVNTLTCSLLRTTEEMKAGKNFAIAVEMIEIVSDDRIGDLPVLLREADSKKAITKGLQSDLNCKIDESSAKKDRDDEEELVVVDAHLSIDITDPYTARVFELPVRGKTCLHRECFDLQTFFDTRKARTSEKDRERAPTNPDEWKCPICKKDARPQNLVIDGFLQKVRKELGERNQLDIKAIKVQADGSWEPVLDTKLRNRRDSMTTDDADEAASRRQSGVGPGPGIAAERWMGGRPGESLMGQGQAESVVIELD